MGWTKKLIFILILPLVIFSSPIFSSNATSNNLFSLSRLKQGHVTFQVGASQGITGKTQHIAIQDLIGDTFTSNKNHDFNALLGLGYYLDGQDFGRVKMSYGINGFYLPNMTATGDVIQEDLFTNLSYSYQLTNVPIYLMAKSTIPLNSPQYALTIDAGVGPNFMHAYAFQEQSLDGGVTIPDSFFSSHTTTTLSGTLGVGLKINRVGKIALECGYRFFYLGQGHFVTSNDQVLNTFRTGQTYVNAIVFSVII
jgi:opacity protein-like surface antigen